MLKKYVGNIAVIRLEMLKMSGIYLKFEMTGYQETRHLEVNK